jgi:hypothetical protein
MPKNTNKGTSPKVASDAARQVSNPKSTAKEREVAASDLAQAPRKGNKKGKKK